MKTKIRNEEYHIFEIYTNDKTLLENSKLIDDPDSIFIIASGILRRSLLLTQRVFLLTKINRVYKRNYFFIRQNYSSHRPKYLSVERIIMDPEPSFVEGSVCINVNRHNIIHEDFTDIQNMIKRISVFKNGK
jgi:hypothetical protein